MAILELTVGRNKEFSDAVKHGGSHLFHEIANHTHLHHKHKPEGGVQTSGTLDFGTNELYGLHRDASPASAKSQLDNPTALKGGLQQGEGQAVRPGTEAHVVRPGSESNVRQGAESHKEQHEAQEPKQGESYSVQQGDSLWKIARETLGKGASNRDVLLYVTEIAEANHFKSLTQVIKPDDVLKLPKHEGGHHATESHAKPALQEGHQVSASARDEETRDAKHIDKSKVQPHPQDSPAPKQTEAHFERVQYRPTEDKTVSAAKLSEDAGAAFLSDMKSGKISAETLSTIRHDLETCIKAGKEVAFRNNFNEVVYYDTKGAMLVKEGNEYTIQRTDANTKETTVLARIDLQHGTEKVEKAEKAPERTERIEHATTKPSDTLNNSSADLNKAEVIARKVISDPQGQDYQGQQDWMALLKKTYEKGGQQAEDQLIASLNKNLKFSGFEIHKDKDHLTGGEIYTLTNKSGQEKDLGPTGKESVRLIQREEANDAKIAEDNRRQQAESDQHRKEANAWQQSAIEHLPKTYQHGSFGNTQERAEFAKLFADEAKKIENGYYPNESCFTVLQKKVEAAGYELDMKSPPRARDASAKTDETATLMIKDKHGKVIDSITLKEY